ncbi:MAG TPA: metallophosphoesterase [Desulfomonilia bacterium]
MRILFTADLHGQVTLYEQMFALSKSGGADVIIMGGDILPTVIDELFDLARGVSAYKKSLDVQIEFIDSYFIPVIREFKKENPAKEIFYIPGNHDWNMATLHLEKNYPEAVNLHGRTVHFSGYDFTGYGCVIDSHFWVKDMVRRDTPSDTGFPGRFSCVSTPEGMKLYKDNSYLDLNPSIEEELSSIKIIAPAKTVCVFHSPPYDTRIDTLHNGKPIGSRAIKDYIDRYQPLISLHGHIHEAPYMTGIYRTAIGKTIAINPGHFKDDLHAVIIDMSEGEPVIRHTLFKNPDCG